VGEGHVEQYKKNFKLYLTLSLLWNGLILISAGYLLVYESSFDDVLILGMMISMLILSGIILANLISNKLTKPTEYLAQAILHVSPNEHLVAAPNVDSLSFGRELVVNLTRQVYDYASKSSVINASPQQTPEAQFLAELPVGVIGIDEQGVVTTANQQALSSLHLQNLVGVPLDTQIKVDVDGQPLMKWIETRRQVTVQATKAWPKVEVRTVGTDTANYYDIVASFRQRHASGTETLIAFFDHSDVYDTEAEDISFIALAVHELRTPLTILRGQIEIFHEELASSLDEEHRQIIDKMSASAENLSAFVTNILSVTKADQDRLSLKMSEENWPTVLQEILKTLELRAKVRGKTINFKASPNIPMAAIDKVSIAEVIINLIDNAIKYSPEAAKNIWVETNLDAEGNILTTVRDEGVGIPESVVPNLFTKFYRNHRNRNQVIGTGLGLYLSRAIVSAHHGQIWIKSHEGQGTTIGFTILPYSRLADTDKKDDNGITQTSHGWIKNHSMQRR
jgi:two-component system, OmpR family, sensor histidine kinase VicK